MKSFFVTGGAGFIGSEFVRVALKSYENLKIVDFDALTYAGNLENLRGLDDARHIFVKGDICDKQAVLDAMPEGVDAVFNFAAESHVDRSIESANEFVETNVLGTQILLDCARERGAGRFVQISTDEVMGTLPERDDAFFTEDSPIAPNSPYAASKAAAEQFVRAARETFGIDTVVTRCGNNYGFRQFPEKLIPLMISNALNDEPLPLYGDGRNVRDWIFVTDHCEAILEVYEKGSSGETYNIGARNPLRNIEVVSGILDHLGKPHSLIKPVEDRLGHDRRYAIDPTRIETELGWKARIGWEEGLAKTIEWYVSNEDWIASVKSGEYQEFYERYYSHRIAQ
ncbi:MAG: dTDP-glucose 4,6-dehydratase [Acidobacteria bacterium]|nr:MAG: dTDP-glucose 4,6-dehydratase [Acidobacteriota bacterium]REJ99092.1 MAG: dTDP-glucose 4,6-dehydratase [Acidobacteriota bacterium]REK16188.1 MAG: dTDP-glucose 4,6-dehydratase [Acidobacteriota bacterium]REK43869.1 MAG: dTDP-glucose 4,6-dehydratase [Acidobacteriota bacterium]